MAGRERSRAGRVLTRVSLGAAVGLAALSTCWWYSGAAWWVDLAANFNAQWLLAGVVLTGACAALGRWKIALLGAGACVSLAASMLVGRAAVLPRGLEDPAAPTSGEVVRLFHYNASTRGDGVEILGLLEASNADVLSVLCPPVAHQRDVIYSPGLEDRYAGKLVRMWRPEADGSGTDVTAGYIVSRWPMRALDLGWMGGGGDEQSSGAGAYLIAGVVERPAERGGPFIVVGVHPRSPRSPRRWAIGNVVVEAVAELAARAREEGMEVVVLTDLNATPTGWRSHRLARSGLRRAKPVLAATGTYPLPLGPGDTSQHGRPRIAPWPLSIALDDALLSDGVRVKGWGTLPRAESEHRPIMVEVRIPSTAGAPGVPVGR